MQESACIKNRLSNRRAARGGSAGKMSCFMLRHPERAFPNQQLSIGGGFTESELLGVSSVRSLNVVVGEKRLCEK